MEDSPLVTVYIPTYNRINLLRRAVESVLNQDYHNIELIVVDDGSSDGTVDYLEALASKNDRVRYFANEKNSGACVSRNRAIFAAKGKFITGLDDDDYFLPDRISSFLATWKTKRAEAIALFSNSYFVKANGRKLVSKRMKLVTRDSLFEMNQIGNQIFLPTVLMQAIGGFDESLPSWQDYDCWFRVFQHPDEVIELAPTATYVADIAHEYQRIGMSSRNKKIKAFNIIAEKVGASERQLDSMKVVLCDSAKIAPPASLVVSKIMLSGRGSNVRLALKVLIKSIIYRWPVFNSIYTDSKG